MLSRLSGSRRIDAALLGVLVAATFVLHDVGYILHAPYWLDETWVAISTKIPATDLRQVTASTPPGWTLLLRTTNIAGFHLGGEQGQRLIPLIFSALTPPVAYILVRRLPWPSVAMSRASATFSAAAVLLSPSSLQRNDLKQYTADAFGALIVLLLVAEAERRGTVRSLLTLAVVVSLGFEFTNAVAPVGLAGFAGVLMAAIHRREWRWARDIVVSGSAAALCCAVLYHFSRPPIPPGLYDFWRAFFVPIHQGVWASVRFLLAHGQGIARFSGVGWLPVLVVLVVAGLVALVRAEHAALATTFVMLIVETILLSVFGLYPFGDERTAHFFTVALLVLATVGAVHLLRIGVEIGRDAWVPSPKLATLLATAAIGMMFVAVAVTGKVRAHSIAAEDVRTPARYVAAHERSGDIVLVSTNSSWGVAYYWPTTGVVVRPSTANLQGFITVPKGPELIVASDSSSTAVASALKTARDAQHRNGDGARLWIIREHLRRSEPQAWSDAFGATGLAPQPIIGTSLLVVNS